MHGPQQQNQGLTAAVKVRSLHFFLLLILSLASKGEDEDDEKRSLLQSEQD